MKLVLDNNALFSIMKPDSASSYLFSSIKCEFIAPEFVKAELDKYREECLSKSELSEQEFDSRRNEVEELIEFFAESKYDAFLTKSVRNLPDPKDAPYLSLALFANAFIWSNDPHLRQQSLVRVFTTDDLVKMFLKGEL